MGFWRRVLCGREGKAENGRVLSTRILPVKDQQIQTQEPYAPPDSTEERNPTQRSLLESHYKERFGADLPPELDEAEVARQYQRVLASRSGTSLLQSTSAESSMTRAGSQSNTRSYDSTPTQVSYSSSSTPRSEAKRPSQFNARSEVNLAYQSTKPPQPDIRPRTSSSTHTAPSSETIPSVPERNPAAVVSSPSPSPPQEAVRKPSSSRQASPRTQTNPSSQVIPSVPEKSSATVVSSPSPDASQGNIQSPSSSQRSSPRAQTNAPSRTNTSVSEKSPVTILFPSPDSLKKSMQTPSSSRQASPHTQTDISPHTIPSIAESSPATEVSCPSPDLPKGHIQTPTSRETPTHTDDDVFGSSSRETSDPRGTDSRSLPTSEFTFSLPVGNHRLSGRTDSPAAPPSNFWAGSSDLPQTPQRQSTSPFNFSVPDSDRRAWGRAESSPTRFRFLENSGDLPQTPQRQSTSTFNFSVPDSNRRISGRAESSTTSNTLFPANTGIARSVQTVSEPQTPAHSRANRSVPGAFHPSIAVSEPSTRNYTTPEPRDEYHILIDHAVRRAHEVGSAFTGQRSSGIGAHGDLPRVSPDSIREMSSVQKGALGEAFVFEVFSSLNIPNFSRYRFAADNWKSCVQKELKDYPDYIRLGLSFRVKNANGKFHYTDNEGTLTRFLMRNCVGGFPANPTTTANGAGASTNLNLPIEYWFQVKSTPNDRWSPFSFTDEEYACLQNNNRNPTGQQCRQLYVLLKVYDLGPRIAMDIYVEPRRLARRGGCLEEFRLFKTGGGKMGTRPVRGTH